MDKNWFIRLQESRKKAEISLQEASQIFKISQQSIIKYEKGEVYPQINVLDNMCEKYNVPISYILYGEKDIFKEKNVDDQLTTLFFLLFTKKLILMNKGKSLKINDQKLGIHIFALNTFIKYRKPTNIDDFYHLIDGIQMMADEENLQK